MAIEEMSSSTPVAISQPWIQRKKGSPKTYERDVLSGGAKAGSRGRKAYG